MVKPKDISLFKTSHLGINPVSGGKPDRERMLISIVAIRRGDRVQMVAISLIVVDSDRLSNRKIGVVVRV